MEGKKTILQVAMEKKLAKRQSERVLMDLENSEVAGLLAESLLSSAEAIGGKQPADEAGCKRGGEKSKA